jgi:DNA-binding beta-propeller fold protein YncE
MMTLVRANHPVTENVTRPRGDHPIAARENGTMQNSIRTAPRHRRSGVTILGVLLALSASPATFGASQEPESPLPALWESSRPSLNLAVDPEGRLWATTPESTFDIYDRDGNLLETWGTFGREEGQFDFVTPCGPRGGVAFRPDGGFYVADSDNARIQEFDADRRFVRAWGSYGEAEDQFIGPDSIALDGAGNIYVNETCGQRHWIHVFDPQGEHIRVIGSADQGPFFTVAADGTVYTFDEAALDLVRIRPDGTTEAVADLSGLVSYGTGVLHLADGRFLAASELSGVTETGPEHLVLIDADGEAVGAWTGGGWWMAADPAGDRFYITSDKLRAHAVPAS